MKKLTFLVLLLCLSSVAFAASFDDYTLQQVSQCSKLTAEEVSATATNTTVDFTRDTKAIYVENTGATNEVYIAVNSGVATVGTANEIKLKAGENRALVGFKTRSIGVVCDTAETTTVTVEACY